MWGQALLFGGFREAYFHSGKDVYTIEWKCSPDERRVTETSKTIPINSLL